MRVAGKTTQRTIRIATAIIFTVATGLAASTSPVFAQGHKGSGASGSASPDDTMKRKQRDEEAKAAKAAMDKIPDPKVKYDPWKIER